MKKGILKIFAIALCFSLVFAFAGCAPKVVEIPTDSQTSETEQVLTGIVTNPLTGKKDIDASILNNRPVAIMVNNLKPIAQRIQTGLDKADIVYEAYAEGGVTRLLAVFKDVKAAPQVGSVRSARYSYIDLAMGHDAIYVHAGINDSAVPHVAETGIDNINLLKGYSGMSFREANGEASEHTLYTNGEKLAAGFEKNKWRTTLDYNKENWQKFAPEGAEIVPAGGACDSISVKMSSAYISKFDYDKQTKTYKKFSGSSEHKDYKSGKQLEFKNVLVLKTDVTNLTSDGYIVKTCLDGGEGYYVSNGGYQKIKWIKGSAKNPIKIALEDGSECTYNPGNTWVCLVNKNSSVDITAAETSAAE